MTNSTEAVTKDERAAFDAWCKSMPANRSMGPWEIWQAARAAQPSRADQAPYAYEIGERGRTLELAYPEYLERYATKEERALPRKPLYAAPVAPTPETAELDFKNALTPYGMLVRALRIVAATTLYDMAQHLGSTPAALSAIEFGRKPATDALVRDTYLYFLNKGIPDTLLPLQAALAATAPSDAEKAC